MVRLPGFGVCWCAAAPQRENVPMHILFQKQAKYLIFFVIFSFAIDVSHRKMV